MRILVTSSRMPFALDMIRKLAERGHEVYASDSYEVAPGSHSRYLQGHFVTARRARETERFIDDVEADRARERDRARPARLRGGLLPRDPHERLSRAHEPVHGVRSRPSPAFTTRTASRGSPSGSGCRTPETVVARSDDELREEIARFPRYFARAAFSRGGVSLLTNTGPLAGQLSVDDCHPTPESPWLVQEFVDGPMHCTYSTLHDGRVTAHCAYRAPRQWEHSTGDPVPVRRLRAVAADRRRGSAPSSATRARCRSTSSRPPDGLDADRVQPARHRRRPADVAPRSSRAVC